MSCSISSTAMPRAAISRIDRAEARHLRLRQAGCRLIEQNGARLPGQRARELEQPPLAERQGDTS